eukprot:CAMPEP_0172490436 /NCGR_PEP_ID=MMETSP1066-20121228/20858_1 /TAXON_ID=671091 /ORGANISM="Coscinodiscus wailesii, Strain CCMP2513" /LENGTH=320 /DNA_ID=CAMNT_0013258899 /DNA_START=87 /DNA_END=1046 /DNA_ORIENTATION=+
MASGKLYLLALVFLAAADKSATTNALNPPAFGLRGVNHEKDAREDSSVESKTDSDDDSLKVNPSGGGGVIIGTRISMVSLDYYGKQTWGVDDCNRARYLKDRDTQNWKQPPKNNGRMTTLHTAGNGIGIWGVGTDNKIYRYATNKKEDGWIRQNGNLNQISVTYGEETLYGIWKGNIYVANKNDDYNWNKMSSTYNTMDYVEVSGDGRKVYAISEDGRFFKRNNGNWIWQMDAPQNMKQVSTDHYGKILYAVDEDENLFSCDNSVWRREDGPELKHVSVEGGAKEVMGVNYKNDVYAARVVNGRTVEWKFIMNATHTDEI